MNFRKLNNIFGWVIFIIASLVYIITTEKRGSFWDCGEFVSACYKVQLPHPPGAPLFVLLGRFFIILFGDNPMTAAKAVNIMNAIASGATILFLFWTITHFARKLMVGLREEPSLQQSITIIGAGLVGGLAYTFTDSFWFSAVEGEVYALSSLFTAIAFWCMLKWERADEMAGDDPRLRAYADRWIVFLFFSLGLSIGVHLLGLLVIPAAVMVYYYRRYPYTRKGAIWAFVIGCVITGLVQVGVIQYTIKAAGSYDILYVNHFGLPFFSGFIMYFVLLAVLVILGLRFKESNKDLKPVNGWWYVLLAFVTNIITAIVSWSLTKGKPERFRRGLFMCWVTAFLAILFGGYFISTSGVGMNILIALVISTIGITVGYFFKVSWLKNLRLGLWCFAFMMLGYSTYVTTMERSNANPAMDMNNVDNPISLVYYLGREQYGSQPIFMGAHYAAPPVREDNGNGNPDYAMGKMRYARGEENYVELGKEKEYKYHSKDIQLFPRVWDPSNDQRHVDFYMEWLGLEEIRARENLAVIQVDDEQNIIYTVNQQGKQDAYELEGRFRRQVQRNQQLPAGGTLAFEAPSYGDNIQWFLTYQMGWMYWRYFMWNFAGRQNDLQGFGNKRDGNWITGISMIDNARLGDQSKLPSSIKDKQGTNKLYLLPFLLGIIGAVYHYIRDRKDFIVNLLLFFFTGVAIVVYLNQAGNQPRERDYAFTGSFYAYAVWIGLSVVALVRLAREQAEKISFNKMLIYGSVATFLITAMSCATDSFSGGIISCIIVTAMYALLTFILTFVVRAVGKNNLRTAGFASTAICLIVPLIMAAQEWNDHDRSQKVLAPDIARNYLIGCPKNAILFTFGDNDTYPLWYAQEVEDVRPDIRIINTSLLGIDWYVNQLRYKVNESAPVDVIWSAEQIQGLQGILNGGRDNAPAKPLYNFMKQTVGLALDTREDRTYAEVSMPAQLTIPVNVEYVKSSGLVTAEDSILSEVKLNVSPNKNFYTLDQLTMLNVLATTNWTRPICFTNPYNDLGFGPYIRQVGLIYQLVPVLQSPSSNMDVRKTDSLLRTSFLSGGAERTDVYFDEENRGNLLSIRQTFAVAANGLIDQGKKQEAIEVLKRAEALIKPESLPYGMVSARSGPNRHNMISSWYLEAAINSGYTELANKIKPALRKDLQEQLAYYEYLRDERPEFYSSFAQDVEVCTRILAGLDQMDKANQPPKTPIENPLRKDSAKDTSKKP